MDRKGKRCSRIQQGHYCLQWWYLKPCKVTSKQRKIWGPLQQAPRSHHRQWTGEWCTRQARLYRSCLMVCLVKYHFIWRGPVGELHLINSGVNDKCTSKGRWAFASQVGKTFWILAAHGVIRVPVGWEMISAVGTLVSHCAWFCSCTSCIAAVRILSSI